MLGDFLALGSAACFAVANVTIARGADTRTQDNGVFLSLLLTTAISGVLWIALGRARGFAPITATALLWFAGAGVLTAFIGRVFLYASVQRLGAMRASAIKRLNPFFAVALGIGVLGERLTPAAAVGLLLIAASFAVLVAGARRADPAAQAGAAREGLNWGYLYGPVSALGYASGYLLRKMGLADTPDALLGTMVGTLVGALLFVATAAFSERYAGAVRTILRRPNPWLLLAGTMSSFGQILYFAALGEAPLSRVALIASIEVFVTIFLGLVLLRQRESLTPAVAIAAVLGVAGTAWIFVS